MRFRRPRLPATASNPTIVCWLLATPGAAWALVRATGLERGPLVQLVAFTPYAAAASVLPAVLALALRRWTAAVAAGLAAVALLAGVLPRALPGNGPKAAGPRLRVLTANLFIGAARPAALVDLVVGQQVDVLAVQEYTPEAEAALIERGLLDLLPYRISNPTPGASGSALFARYPLRDTGVRQMLGGLTQVYATVTVPGAPPVVVESVHPAAPHTLRALRWWRTDLAAQQPATPDGPVRVLAGDFNATLDHAPLRRLIGTGYRDAAAAVGAGLIGTWGPYDGAPIPPVAIDHLLADRRVGVEEVSVRPLPGSDHRALLATLVLPAAA